MMLSAVDVSEVARFWNGKAVNLYPYTVYYVRMRNCTFSAILSQAIGTPIANNSYNAVALAFEWRNIPSGMTIKRFDNILIFTMLAMRIAARLGILRTNDEMMKIT